MPLGTPELLDTFVLGGAQLQASAPEQLHDGLKAAFKFFFFAKGDPTVQPGRVTPKPITLDFKLNGPDALSTMQFFKRMTAQQQEIPLKWTDRINFSGYLTDFDATYTQKVVTGTLTYQPVKDLANKDALPGNLKDGSTASPTENLKDALDNATTASTNISSLLTDLQNTFTTDLGPVFSVLNTGNDLLAQVNSALSTYYEVASIPYEVASQFGDLAKGFLIQLPSAFLAINNLILAPVVPLLQGTDDYLAKALAEQASWQFEDLGTNVSLLAQYLSPQPLIYTVVHGDTLQAIADLFGVLLASLLHINPGLSDASLTAGSQLAIPSG
jgi:LysM repeat protein